MDVPKSKLRKRAFAARPFHILDASKYIEGFQGQATACPLTEFRQCTRPSLLGEKLRRAARGPDQRLSEMRLFGQTTCHGLRHREADKRLVFPSVKCQLLPHLCIG